MKIIFSILFICVFVWNAYSITILTMDLTNNDSEYPLGRGWASAWLAVNIIEAVAMVLAFLIIHAKI